MARFPNTAKAVITLFEPLAPTVRWLTSLDRLPIVHVHALSKPGQVESWERQDRIKVDIYDRDYDDAEELAERLRDQVAGRSHGTPHGFLDHVWIEVEPYPVNYPVESIIQFTFTIRVDVRATNKIT
ncbi:hypothetical protein [Flaviflexus massiliensis]|uniref:hypothetical protein n=1 Tax=Flaviflexus massiliensis TaxID=1522309 RepID=UPI0006D58568|nr:hypothetical protein [Flaviflexus massiliensis]